MNNSLLPFVAVLYYLCDIKKLVLIFLLALSTLSARAQFTDSGTGLLRCPSADMNNSGVFTITNNFLNRQILPTSGWDYSTFAYGFGITFWSRVEIGYVCTIFNGDWSPIAQSPSGTYRQRIMKNQDRHFTAKFLVLREGEFGSDWVPSVAVGISDPVTGSGGGEYIGSDVSGVGNGFFNRTYIVATKHFDTTVGQLSASLGYQYTLRIDPHYNAPCAAVTWRPVWLENRWFNPNFIFEFDSRTPNFGFIADIWDSRFEAMFVLQNFQWISFGLRYKLRLAGAE